jgi:hypothetical protein
MADKKDIRRRVLGAFFLVAAVILLVVGQTVFSEHLQSRPMEFLLFWLACFIFIGLALLTALMDLVVVRRRVRDEQRELLQQTLEKIEKAREEERRQSAEPRDLN